MNFVIYLLKKILNFLIFSQLLLHDSQKLFVQSSKLVTNGTEHACLLTESVLIPETQCKQISYQVKKTKFCLDILEGFRCTQYETKYRTSCINVAVVRNVTKWECCDGFAETTDGDCIPCAKNMFGKNCGSVCKCENGDYCNPVDGTCTCSVGHNGTNCEQKCVDWKYGLNCAFDCVCVRNQTDTCNNTNGLCSCKEGFTGEFCADPCPRSHWGPNCLNHCTECYNGGLCDRVSGKCQCTPGYTGNTCEQFCPKGFFGNECEQTCDCEFGAECDPISGSCTCNQYLWGKRCEDLRCPEGKYGTNCSESCVCENGGKCDAITGSCNCTTAKGYTGVKCTDGCPHNSYGPNCSLICDCEQSLYCNAFLGCVFQPDTDRGFLVEEKSDKHESKSVLFITLLSLLVSLTLISFIIIGILIYRRLMCRNSTSVDTPSGYPNKNGFINPLFHSESSQMPACVSIEGEVVIYSANGINAGSGSLHGDHLEHASHSNGSSSQTLDHIYEHIHELDSHYESPLHITERDQNEVVRRNHLTTCNKNISLRHPPKTRTTDGVNTQMVPSANIDNPYESIYYNTNSEYSSCSNEGVYGARRNTSVQCEEQCNSDSVTYESPDNSALTGTKRRSTYSDVRPILVNSDSV